MTDLFSTQVRFNDGNPQLFRVRYINVRLKGLKDQLNEINQGLNPEIQGRWNTFGMNVQRGRGENIVQSARINERREEHVLNFLAAHHVPVDQYVCYVVETA